MKPAPFRYERPDTLEQALALLHRHASADVEAKALAGGQSLVPLLSLRLARPAVIVDLNRLDELAGVERRGDHIRLGALTRHEQTATDPVLRQAVPLLAQAATHVGHRAIRSRGTLGGSLAHADPAAELPLAALALGAEVELASVRGTRTLAIAELFTGALSTCLEPDELIVALRVPVETARRPFGFAELARRPGDFAVALAAVTVSVDADGGCRAATVAVGGAGGSPQLIGPAARALIGTRLEHAAVSGAVRLVEEQIRPYGDLHGSADYRRAMVALMARRAIDQARGAR